MNIKNFKGKYDILIETAITRFEMGGLLSGDVVKFRKDALKNEKVLKLTDQYKAMIEDAINTDLNLKVSAIKSIHQTTTQNYSSGQGAGTRSPADHYVDIVVEYAPGLWKNPITVPIEVLERVDTGINLAPVPDSLKRKSESEMPKEVESLDADRKNPNSNTKPEFETKTTDGRSQISKPKEISKKNQGKLTLEDVYGNMMGAKPGATPGATPGAAPGITSNSTSSDPKTLTSYKLTFGQPYGKNPDELIKRIQGMEGLSNNMDAKFDDDNNLTIKANADIDPETLKKMVSNVVTGSVNVVKGDDGMTKITPNKTGASTSSGSQAKGTTISSGSQAIGA